MVRIRSMNLSVEEHFKPLSSDMMKMLDHVESKFSLYDLRVKGAPLWPLLRIRWFFSEWTRLYAAQESTSVSGSKVAKIWQQISPWLRRLLDRRLLLPVKAEGHHRVDLVFFSDGISFTNLQGIWFERFCDPLIEQAKEIGLTSTLWSPVDIKNKPSNTFVFSFQPKIAMRTLMAASLAKLTWEELPIDMKALNNEFQSMGYETIQFSPNKMLVDAYRVRMLRKMFQRRLALARPQLACIVNYYSLEGMAFVWACKQLDIPVVDLQHGVQGEYHPAYAGWKVPNENKGLLLVPDYFWVWSEIEAITIKRSVNGSAHQAYVGGNPWAQLWNNGDTVNPLITGLLNRGSALQKHADEKPVILVTLQYGLSYSEQLEPLRVLIGIAHENFAFWVRLHPMMLDRRKEVREYLGPYPIELDEASDLPLHALLPFCDIHITHSSSTVIEAADYGIPSLITTAFGAELFPEKVKEGVAKLVDGGPAAIFEALKQQVLNKKNDGTRVSTNRDSSLEGLLELIESTKSGIKA